MRSTAGRALVYSVLVLSQGCGGGLDITERSLRDARRLWNQSNIRDYDIEWTATGPRNGHYLVTVRSGRVSAVRSVLDNPRAIRANGGRDVIEAHPAQPAAYGVDGLFQILEEERELAAAERPFGQPKGSRVLLKFTPDPKLGYPRRYRRDVVGSNQGIAIDVVRFHAISGQ
jgi:hypothetical protein